MSRATLVIKCASVILAVGLGSPVFSGTACAEGELGQGGEWPDAAYSTSPDNDALSEADLSAITDVLRQAWADELSDPAALRLSIAERDALMAEAEAEKQIALTRGAGELENQAAQVEAAYDMVGGAISSSGSALPRPTGDSTGSSVKGGTTDSSTSKSPDRSSPSP